MFIEKATKKDLPIILDLQYLAYQSESKLLNNLNIPPLKQTLSDIIDEFNKGIILKATDNNKIIGSVRGYVENSTLYIGKLIVHPKFQRKGIGTKLLLSIENLYDDVNYELFTSNRSSRNILLYENLGYKKYREEMIGDNLTLIYLRKELN